MKPFLFVAAMYYTWFAPVTITVRPTVDMAPAAFQATVFIERHADNRLLEIEYDGPEYRKSNYVLDGAQSQRAFQPRHWTLRAVGEYLATATVTRITQGHKKQLVSTATFRVAGADPYAPFEW